MFLSGFLFQCSYHYGTDSGDYLKKKNKPHDINKDLINFTCYFFRGAVNAASFSSR